MLCGPHAIHKKTCSRAADLPFAGRIWPAGRSFPTPELILYIVDLNFGLYIFNKNYLSKVFAELKSSISKKQEKLLIA